MEVKKWAEMQNETGENRRIKLDHLIQSSKYLSLKNTHIKTNNNILLPKINEAGIEYRVIHFSYLLFT